MPWTVAMLARLLRLDDQSIDDVGEAQRADSIEVLSAVFPDVVAAERALTALERRRRPWSPSGLASLRKHYADTPTREIASRIGRPLHQVYGKARKLGLEKSAEFLAKHCRMRRGSQIGREFRFKKGQVPPNKGLRRPGYAPGRMAETQFKKGSATNWMPVGSTRLVDGYVYRKVSDIRNVPWTRNWRLEHFLVWERAHGAVPPSHALAFKDRNRENTALENLELITRRELMARNTVHNLPKELVEVVQLRGALVRQINKRSRCEEQDSGSAQPPVRDARGSQGSRQAHGSRQGACRG